MTVAFIRFAGCFAALYAASLIFPDSVTLSGAVWGSVMLLVLYTLLRPLLLLIALPFNLFAAGLLTPFADALFVRWTAAWIPGLMLTYLQSVAVALIISLFYFPYSLWKKRLLSPL